MQTGGARSLDENTKSETYVTTSPRVRLISDDVIHFLRELISKSAVGVESSRPTALEVARIRLLGIITIVSGNDEQSLGVHDSNLMFLERERLKLGLYEKYGLIDAGLVHFSSKATPLWYWIASVDGLSDGLLPHLSIFGFSLQRIGALQAMRYVAEPLPNDGDQARSKYLEAWLSKESSSDLKVAALAYLGDYGRTEDLPAIRAELDAGEHQSTYAAVDAILRIKLRDSREDAIRSLIELQPDSVKPRLLRALFEKGSSIETSLLTECLGHRNADVRRLAVSLLRERGAMDVDAANRLIFDPDASVRYEAFLSLVDSGQTFSDDQVKGILVKQIAGAGLMGSDFAGPT